VRSAYVEIDVDAYAAEGQLIDEKIQPVESLGFDCPAVSGIPQPPRPAGRVHVMAPDAVDARRRHSGRYVWSIGVCGHVRSERQIHSPDANALGSTIKMPVNSPQTLILDADRLERADSNRRIEIRFCGNHERNEVLSLRGGGEEKTDRKKN